MKREHCDIISCFSNISHSASFYLDWRVPLDHFSNFFLFVNSKNKYNHATFYRKFWAYNRNHENLSFEFAELFIQDATSRRLPTPSWSSKRRSLPLEQWSSPLEQRSSPLKQRPSPSFISPCVLRASPPKPSPLQHQPRHATINLGQRPCRSPQPTIHGRFWSRLHLDLLRMSHHQSSK